MGSNDSVVQYSKFWYQSDIGWVWKLRPWMKQSIDPITPVWSNTNTSVGIDTIHICILIKQFNKLELGLLLRTFPSESTLFFLSFFALSLWTTLCGPRNIHFCHFWDESERMLKTCMIWRSEILFIFSWPCLVSDVKWRWKHNWCKNT